VDYADRLKSLDLKYKIGIGVALIVLAPALILLLKSLIATIAIGAVCLATINFAPVFSQKLANWKLAATIDEARKRPIIDATSVLDKKQREFDESVIKVKAATGARDTFIEKCREFSKQYPHRADEFHKRAEQFAIRVEKLKVKLAEFKVTIDNGRKVVQEMSAYYEMTKALDAANAAINMGEMNSSDQIRLDTAWNSVLQQMNSSFADLEIAEALAKDPEAPLPAQPTSPKMPQLEQPQVNPAAGLFAKMKQSR